MRCKEGVLTATLRRATNVRLASASDPATAFAVAMEMVGDGFTAWVFETQRAGGRKSYRLLETLQPASRSR